MCQKPSCEVVAVGRAEAKGEKQRNMSLPHSSWDPTVCPSCGQLHEPQGTHLYDYYQAVDEDLMCQICLQPLVSPLDTRCGHTFCARCLRNYLRIQRQCPIDRKALSLKECQLSSILVRRSVWSLCALCIFVIEQVNCTKTPRLSL